MAVPARPGPQSISPLDVVRQELLDPPDRPIRGGSRTDAGVVLDQQLVVLAGMESRCRLVIARLALRLMNARSWRRLGFVRLSDYARERIGVSSRTLEEDARVVRTLDRLPRLCSALEAGLLGWTKVRMLVRVATTQNEEALLHQALTLPTRELEEFVRTFAAEEQVEAADEHSCDVPARPADDAISASAPFDQLPDPADESDPEIRWSINVSRTGRRLWRAVREAASRVAGSPLSPAQVLELVAAEAASGSPNEFVGADAKWSPSFDDHQRRLLALQRSDEARGRRTLFAYLAETGVAEGFPWLAPATYDAGPAACLEKLTEDLETADAFELDRRLRDAHRAMQRIDYQMGALLRIGVDRRLFREIGFATVKLYVESRLGCSARKVWSLIAIERETWRSCEQLRAAWRDGEISHLAACTILPVVGPHYGEQWIRRAREVTLRRLAEEVAWALEFGERASTSGRPAPPPLHADLKIDGLAGVTVDEVQMRAHGEDIPRLKLPGEEVRIAFSLPVSVAALVESMLFQVNGGRGARGRAFERMIARALLEWTSAPRHRDPVFERDGWRCTVPGCSSRRNLHDHHVKFRSAGGSNARGNRTTVCAAHHLHGIHAGIVQASGLAPHDITWELGCRPGEPPLMRLHGDRYVTA
ncbi:MAG TPA: HNH endonuclease signature motif containing protein [Candidatus Limnocylindrales bacterium]|nr:HNH endonuclease signature motif containing protein [Candidatus Limnocylindrales bacterium]